MSKHEGSVRKKGWEGEQNAMRDLAKASSGFGPEMVFEAVRGPKKILNLSASEQ